MSKTKFEKFEAGGPDTAAFKISGKLGFHENKKVEQLVEECLKRGFERVIFDFSEVTSLGGRVARILRNFVEEIGRRDLEGFGDVDKFDDAQPSLSALIFGDEGLRLAQTHG